MQTPSPSVATTDVVTLVLPIRDKGDGKYELTYDHPPHPGAKPDKAEKKRRSLLPADMAYPDYEKLKHQVEEGDGNAAREVGELLFTFLFGGTTGMAYFREWRAFASGRSSVLRIALEIDRDLASEPWEYVYHTELEWLATNRFFSIVRCLWTDAGSNRESLVRVPAEATVLVLVSTTGHNNASLQLDTKTEVKAIKDAFPGARVLDGKDATLRGLQDYLAQSNTQYTVIHFIGHGGAGTVLVSDEPVGGGQFARLIQSLPSLRMLVFASCASADLIWPLIQIQGIPAIIAMQYDFFDRPAAEFASALYKQLSAGAPIDIAVNEARRRLSNSFPRAVVWGYPTISVRKYPNDRVDFLAALDPALSVQAGGSTIVARASADTMPLPGSVVPTKGAEVQGSAVTGGDIVAKSCELARSAQTGYRKAHDHPVTALTFVPGKNTLISGDGKAMLRAWRFADLQQLDLEHISYAPGDWTGHDLRHAIFALLVLPYRNDVVVLSAGDDGELRTWRWQDGSPMGPPHTTAQATVGAMATNYQTGAIAFATTADKLLFVTAPEVFIEAPRSLDLASIAEIRDNPGVGSSIVFSPDGKWLAAAAQRTQVRVWDCSRDRSPSRQPVELAHESMSYVHSLAAMSPTRIAAGTESGQIWLWDVPSRSVLQQPIDACVDTVKWTAWFDNRRLFLAASSSEVGLWKVPDKILAQTWSWQPPMGASICSLAVEYRRDGDVFAVGLSSGAVFLFVLEGGAK